VTGNWKRDAIIKTLAEADGPLIASEIAEQIPSLNRREVCQYISYNMRYKYIHAERMYNSRHAAPWTHTYTLTHTGIDYYKRKLTPTPCPRPCKYHDQDAVICNEEPQNCPRRRNR